MRRFPRGVYDHGDEPDVRFSLANERTFLAGIRTSLALLAGGVALELLGLDMHAGLQLSAALVLVVAGIAMPLLAWRNWTRAEVAMRRGEQLPGSALGWVMTVAVTVAGVLILLAFIIR